MANNIQKIKYSVNLQANPMKPGEAKKAYGNIQLNGKVSLEQLAAHIHSHGSVYPRDTIIGVTYALVDCTKEFLSQGFKVDLGDLGCFGPGIKSQGAKDLESFSAENITDLRVRYSMSKYLKDLRINADFEKVASRKAQAAIIAAEAQGSTTADWTPEEQEEGEGE